MAGSGLFGASMLDRVRTLARAVAQAYFDARAALGFPMASERLRNEVLEKLQAEAS